MSTHFKKPGFIMSTRFLHRNINSTSDYVNINCNEENIYINNEGKASNSYEEQEILKQITDRKNTAKSYVQEKLNNMNNNIVKEKNNGKNFNFMEYIDPLNTQEYKGKEASINKTPKKVEILFYKKQSEVHANSENDSKIIIFNNEIKSQKYLKHEGDNRLNLFPIKDYNYKDSELLKLNTTFNNVIQESNINNKIKNTKNLPKKENICNDSQYHHSVYRESQRKELEIGISFRYDKTGKVNNYNHPDKQSYISEFEKGINSTKFQNKNLNTNNNQVIYEGIVSKFLKMDVCEVLIPRFCRLTNLNFEIYKDTYSAEIKKYPPLLMIPIKLIKCVERIKIMNEKTTKNMKKRKYFAFAIFLFEGKNILQINTDFRNKLDNENHRSISPKVLLQRSISVILYPIKSLDLLSLNTIPNNKFEIKLANLNLSTKSKLASKKSSLYSSKEKMNDSQNNNFLERESIIFLQNKKDLDSFHTFSEEVGITILKNKKKIQNLQLVKFNKMIKTNLHCRKNEDNSQNYYIFFDLRKKSMP